ncbi:MAG TPA: TerB N-terminal domain-containing protein [Anaerolineaceae bacterium]|nr:TerB N-terminal domain-containing protein [Anaerolineaceae bacterium]
MEELVGIKQSLDVQLQGIPLQIGKTADRPKKLLPISTALVSREPHPAKLLLIENSYANRSQTGATINFAINLDDITGIRIIGPEEPSVIYKDLLVSEPKNPDLVAPPPYFPRYSELSANQRWVYLNWLNDIQSEINIGYVFLYYYGLERHLLVGDFEAAFSEILLLRKCHDNKSFENYSYNALLFSCACHNQPDLAQSILDNESRNGIGNVDLIFKYRFGKNINADEFMSLARKIKGVNLRYIKTQPVRYKTALENVLFQKFRIREYPICSLHNVTDVPQEQVVAFANISLPHDLRTPRLPNFLRHVPFVLDCAEILKHTHDLVKEELKEDRTQ